MLTYHPQSIMDLRYGARQPESLVLSDPELMLMRHLGELLKNLPRLIFPPSFVLQNKVLNIDGMRVKLQVRVISLIQHFLVSNSVL